MLKSNFFLKLGGRVRDKYKNHIWKDAKDVYDQKFKRYSNEYSKRKSSGDIRRQAADSRNTRAPYVTGDLRNDFSLIKYDKGGFQVGWATRGSIVQSLNKRGRKLTTKSQPFQQKLIEFKDREVFMHIEHKILPSKTKRHKVIIKGS